MTAVEESTLISVTFRFSETASASALKDSLRVFAQPRGLAHGVPLV
jgi:hypothetical protein